MLFFRGMWCLSVPQYPFWKYDACAGFRQTGSMYSCEMKKHPPILKSPKKSDLYAVKSDKKMVCMKRTRNWYNV
jgi:hypothetical protein